MDPDKRFHTTLRFVRLGMEFSVPHDAGSVPAGMLITECLGGAHIVGNAGLLWVEMNPTGVIIPSNTLLVKTADWQVGSQYPNIFEL